MLGKKDEEKVEKKVEAKPAAKKEVPMSTEAIIMGMKKDLKEGEELVIKLGGAEFLVKEVHGLELVLVRKGVK